MEKSQKDAIRLTIRKARKEHHPLTKREKDATIQQKLMQTSAWKDAKVILLYAPIPHEKEVDTWPLVERLLDEGRKVALPLANKDDTSLTLKLITSIEDAETKNSPFPEPKSSCETIEPSEVDLAVIPGVAFDTTGNRLGFGKGYYDRLLKKLTCPILALAYDFQILHAVPRHEHDVPVHHIITEEKTYTTS